MSHSKDLQQAALDYHRANPPGKIKVAPTKPLVTQRDLSLAYSPGVAAACEAIVADPNEVSRVTARQSRGGDGRADSRKFPAPRAGCSST